MNMDEYMRGESEVFNLANAVISACFQVAKRTIASSHAVAIR